MNRTFRTYERKYVLSFDNSNQMELLMENLHEYLRHVEFLVTGVPKRLKITLRGEKEVVKQAGRTLKWLQKSIQGIASTDHQGQYRWDSNYFQRIIGGVSPDMVLKTMKLLGYKIDLFPNYFLINADINEIQDVVDSIHRIWGELSNKYRSQSLKRVVTLVSVIRNKEPDQILEEGINRGIISEKDNKLTLNPEQSLEMLLDQDITSK